jgi:hypothetical protein
LLRLNKEIYFNVDLKGQRCRGDRDIREVKEARVGSLKDGECGRRLAIELMGYLNKVVTVDFKRKARSVRIWLFCFTHS